MTQPKDGGPAFPHVERPVLGYPGAVEVFTSGGMSLRDYFAAQALAGIGTWMPGSGYMLVHEEAIQARAKWAYAQADAMLKARTPNQTAVALAQRMAETGVGR